MIARRGARLALIGTNAEALQKLAGELEHAFAVPGDLSHREGCDASVDQAMSKLGGTDVLINLAGLMSFCTCEDEDIERVQRLMHVNLLAPLILSRALLPGMLAQGKGQIVNVGSTFGSIDFAHFSAYSASKFGLRGFSQALRRKLADTPIDITYVSSRAVKIPLHSGPIMQMGAAIKVNMDEPAPIAAKILKAIEAEKKEAYFGFPVSLLRAYQWRFARIRRLCNAWEQ